MRSTGWRKTKSLCVAQSQKNSRLRRCCDFYGYSRSQGSAVTIFSICARREKCRTKAPNRTVRRLSILSRECFRSRLDVLLLREVCVGSCLPEVSPLASVTLCWLRSRGRKASMLVRRDRLLRVTLITAMLALQAQNHKYHAEDVWCRCDLSLLRLNSCRAPGLEQKLNDKPVRRCRVHAGLRTCRGVGS